MGCRDLKELLTILRDSLAKGNKIGYENLGICSEIMDLYLFDVINHKERIVLGSYVHNNKPKKTEDVGGYWWPVMNENPEYRQVRIDYIDELINKL